MATAHEFDLAHRTFVSYIDKSREYYLAQGYGNPYRWAFFDDVPFTPLSKPLAQSRLALITTTTEIQPGDDDGPSDRPNKRVYSAPTDPPPARLYTADLSWDKDATHTDDLDSYFPVHRLQEFAGEGRISSLAARFHGAPTEYSQLHTIERDAPEILRRCREDGVDAAILVPL